MCISALTQDALNWPLVAFERHGVLGKPLAKPDLGFALFLKNSTDRFIENKYFNATYSTNLDRPLFVLGLLLLH